MKKITYSRELKVKLVLYVSLERSEIKFVETEQPKTQCLKEEAEWLEHTEHDWKTVRTLRHKATVRTLREVQALKPVSKKS